MNQHPRNQILHAIAHALAPLEANGQVKKIAVSLTSSKDQAPYIVVRSGDEQVEQQSLGEHTRQLMVFVQTTVHADDDALDLLDALTLAIEQHAPTATVPPELQCEAIELAGTTFPDLPGDSLAAAIVVFRVTYTTPTPEDF